METLRESTCVKPLDLESTNTESLGPSQQYTDVTEVRKCVEKIKTVTGDAKFLEALLAMERRIEELESQTDE